MQSKFLLSAIAGLFVGGAAFAQTNPAPTAPAAATAPAASTKAPSAAERAARMQQRLDQHFAKLDQNGDGFISRDEAATDKRLAKRFDDIDANKDGKLDKNEMQAHRQAQYQAMRERHAQMAARIKAADTDGDGALTKAEAQAAKLDGIVKHFDQMDANKDGKLTPDEMRASMMARHKAMRGKSAQFDAKFKAADKDGDGALTKAEAEAGQLKGIVTHFDEIDANKDGKVTREELRASMMGMHKRS